MGRGRRSDNRQPCSGFLVFSVMESSDAPLQGCFLRVHHPIDIRNHGVRRPTTGSKRQHAALAQQLSCELPLEVLVKHTSNCCDTLRSFLDIQCNNVIR